MCAFMQEVFCKNATVGSWSLDLRVSQSRERGAIADGPDVTGGRICCVDVEGCLCGPRLHRNSWTKVMTGLPVQNHGTGERRIAHAGFADTLRPLFDQYICYVPKYVTYGCLRRFHYHTYEYSYRMKIHIYDI